jgi:hypothetical protein
LVVIAEAVFIHGSHGVASEPALSSEEDGHGRICLITVIARELSKIHRGKEDRFLAQARVLLEQAFRSVEAT